MLLVHNIHVHDHDHVYKYNSIILVHDMYVCGACLACKIDVCEYA